MATPDEEIAAALEPTDETFTYRRDGFWDAVEERILSEPHPYHQLHPGLSGGSPSRFTDSYGVSGEVALPRSAPRHQAPDTQCVGCRHYVGFHPVPTAENPRGESLVCAMHPYGPDAMDCEDREISGLWNLDHHIATPPARARCAPPNITIRVDDTQIRQAINRVVSGLDERIVALAQASEAAQREMERLGIFTRTRLPVRQWATDPLGISDWMKAQTADMVRVWAHGFDAIAEFLHDCASRLD
ncbi:MAG: hypothetical protein AAFX78_03505 [Cyanobacteria bacterium J06638_20]